MNPPDKKRFSSKQLLEKIGLNEIGDSLSNPSLELLEDETDMAGDIVPLLRERYRQLKEVRHTLRPGMVIQWKPGLRNRRWPAYGKPGIVVSLLAEPVFDNEEGGTTYFREPLDMIIGFFLDSGPHRGDFLVFHASTERYQPWPGEEV
jgi:hypothetical protein